MRIDLQFSTSTFNYTAPITVQKNIIKTNQLLRVSIFNKDIFLGKIDLSPLPFFHQYSLKEWQYVLLNFFFAKELNLENIKLDLPFFNMTESSEDQKPDGELLFIIENILFKIIEYHSPQILNLSDKKIIKVNSLHNNFIQMTALPDCLKIKIRPTLKNLDETIHLINEVITYKPNILLRLDGNKTFELSELQFFMNKLEKECGPILSSLIDYIEEPFKNFFDIHSFKQRFNYSVALDESLFIYKNHLNLLPLKSQLVLKPSLFGISKSVEILKNAPSFKHNVVISSAYETTSALEPLLYLAAMNPKTYHGLDTSKFLPKEFGIESDKYTLKFWP